MLKSQLIEFLFGKFKIDFYFCSRCLSESTKRQKIYKRGKENLHLR